MFILCEKLENNLFAPIINEFGYISKFEYEIEANIERIYLQPDYINEIVVKGE